MHEKDQQKADLDWYDERIRDEDVRILVEDLRPQEDHRIARQVQNQICEEREAREADQQLGAHR